MPDVKKALVKKYGEFEGLQRWKRINDKKRIKIIDRFIKKYGEIEGPIKYEEWNKLRCDKSLDAFIRRYGEEEGVLKFNKFKEKEKIKGTLEGYIERYGKIQGPLQYYEKNKKLSVGEKSLRSKGLTEERIEEIKKNHARKSAVNKNYYIQKYGEEEGEIKWQERKRLYKESTRRCVEFYLKRGYSIEEAKLLVKDFQRRDLDFYIKKYGEEEGIKKFSKSRWNFGHSKIEIELFNSVVSYFPIDYQTNFYYGANQFRIGLKKDMWEKVNGRKLLIPDFIDRENKKIIEFYGDIFHANPLIFNENDVPNPFNKKLTSKDIWLTDFNKISYLRSMGYKILIIWEKDYNEDKNKEIKKCITFLKEGN